MVARLPTAYQHTQGTSRSPIHPPTHQHALLLARVQRVDGALPLDYLELVLRAPPQLLQHAAVPLVLPLPEALPRATEDVPARAAGAVLQ